MRIFIYGLVAVGAISSMLSMAPAAQAQKVDLKNGRQQANWYKSRPQVQITDDRPIISDFRGGPAGAPMQIELPPPPAGFNGGPVMSGGAAPVMSVPAAAGAPNYVANPAAALPKSGFGASNIPAGGLGPKTALPSGRSTGIHGKMMPTAKAGGGPAAAARPAVAGVPGPRAAAYGSGYVTPSGNAGSGMRTTTAVSGSLLNAVKNRK